MGIYDIGPVDLSQNGNGWVGVKTDNLANEFMLITCL